MAGEAETIEIEGRRIAVSNLDKILYPASRFTKGRVIDYYRRIAPFLLPHLKNRPVTLKRFPDGVRGAFFYQKDAPSFTPEWVKTFPVPRRQGRPAIQYLLINDLPTLVWVANLASLEIHPFLHRAPHLEQPTSVVFDLDPGEGSDILTCARAAFLVRDLLKELSLECFPKVSGSKGLQLYIPLNTTNDYKLTQPIARDTADLLCERHPGLIVSTMAKSARTGKVFIDWSQNSDFKTTVAVYSLRAKSERPFVSAPVTWDELSAATKAKKASQLCFSPDEVLRRCESVGDLFAPVLTLKQKLPRAAEEWVARAKPHKPRASAPNRHAELHSLPNAAMGFVEPMLARLVKELPEGPQWSYELKLDGFRCLAVKSGEKIDLFSRRANKLNSRFPILPPALKALPDGTMLDGEIVVMDEKGRPSFNALQNWRPSKLPIFYFAFDVLAYRGKDVRSLPFSERRRLLESALAGLADPVRLSPTFPPPASKLVKEARAQGLEGIMAKRIDSPYESGMRSGVWVKLKTAQSQELVVGGFIPGTHVFDSLLVGYYDAGKLMFLAKVRNGFTPALRHQVARRFRGLATSVCPFANLPEPKSARAGKALTSEFMKECRWLKPKLVAQIEFADWTKDNNLRQSSFAGLRDDKNPRDVIRETAA